MSDSRLLAAIDKRMPASMAGDAGKVLTVGSNEAEYEHVATTGRLPGEIIMWPLNAPPAGYLSCRNSVTDTTEYLTTSYPTLGALLEPVLPGPSGAGYFQTPTILFPKNSAGFGTLTVEAESVGTHGHTSQAVPGHSHAGAATSSVGNHTHQIDIPIRPAANGTGATGFGSGAIGSYTSTGSGAHNHSVSIPADGGHTPVVDAHNGVNQPRCTALHFCIKT